MRLSRFFTEDHIKLEMETIIEPPTEGGSINKWRQEGKRLIVNELVELLERNSRIGNRTKLISDFVNREKKASTGIGNGVALPHIRSLQAKELTICLARSSQGYDFDSLDGQPTYLFFVMTAPPYDDSMYLKVFKSLIEMLQYEAYREKLLKAPSAGEIIRAIKEME